MRERVRAGLAHARRSGKKLGPPNDRRFRAFDAKTGKVLWEHQLEAGAYTSPSTYQGKDGRQYVVVVATGGGYYESGQRR